MRLASVQGARVLSHLRCNETIFASPSLRDFESLGILGFATASSSVGEVVRWRTGSSEQKAERGGKDRSEAAFHSCLEA